MEKNLGDKRNELSPEQIDEITKLYSRFKHGGKSKVKADGKIEDRVCSKIFDNRDFGFIKLVVERPLRLNFQASPERIERLSKQPAFVALGESKKRKNKREIAKEVEAGKQKQGDILKALAEINPDRIYRNRDEFKKAIDDVFESADLTLTEPVYKAVLAALSERDPTADICRDAKGNAEADPELRDTESVALPRVPLPLPIGYKAGTGKEPNNEVLVKLVKTHCDDYFGREVRPHWSDAWIDYSKTRVGYEIPINRHFYTTRPRGLLMPFKRTSIQLRATF
jgi:type I restriction enzyme M protein